MNAKYTALTVSVVLLLGTYARGADVARSSAPPLKVAPPAVNSTPTNTPLARQHDLTTPYIHSYSSRSTTAGAELTVFGGGFTQIGSAHRVRIGGSGYGRELPPKKITPNALTVEIPQDVRPGPYYIGIADASGRWLSSIDQRFEVVDPLRPLTVLLAVQVGCEHDVRSSAPSVELRISPTGRDATTANVTLMPAGERVGPNGSRFYDYRGTSALRVGTYIAADTGGRFETDFWDYINGNSVPAAGGGRYIERTNWEDCHARRRVTARGSRLPGPERKQLQVRMTDTNARIAIAPDTRELRLSGYPGPGGGLGSLPTPTPVDF